MDIFWQVLASIGVLVTTLGGLLKYVISDWIKKSKELEALKTKNANELLGRLEEDSKKLRLALVTTHRNIKFLSAKFSQNSLDTEALKKSLADTRSSLEIYEQKFALNVKNIIKSELVQLTKNASILKSKV